MRVFIAMTALVTAACAPLTEQELERMEYARVEREEAYRDYGATCQARGGVTIQRVNGRLKRSSAPEPGDHLGCARIKGAASY